MTRAMSHRGPDDESYFVAEQVALGFRRLAIIDVRGGRQPLSNEDGSIQVVFNGEIYNHRTLRAQLEERATPSTLAATVRCSRISTKTWATRWSSS